jgi:hypothetical protein
MTGTPPADRQALYDEIERTRADLGETVQALAAKSDAGVRTTHAVASLTNKIEHSVRAARGHVAEVVMAVADGARARAVAAGEAAGEADVRAVVRNPLTGAATLAGSAVAVVVGLVGRRRS